MEIIIVFALLYNIGVAAIIVGTGGSIRTKALTCTFLGEMCFPPVKSL